MSYANIDSADICPRRTTRLAFSTRTANDLVDIEMVVNAATIARAPWANRIRAYWCHFDLCCN
jgi:hypothetical protein